jgi:hypothetical protein
VVVSYLFMTIARLRWFVCIRATASDARNLVVESFREHDGGALFDRGLLAVLLGYRVYPHL